jgi:hypothetical protein
MKTVEQNIGPGYELTQLYPPYFLTNMPIIYYGKTTASSTNVAGISETRSMSITLLL